MSRYAFLAAPSAVADAPKAAVRVSAPLSVFLAVPAPVRVPVPVWAAALACACAPACVCAPVGASVPALGGDRS
ncbi:hypothetical protein [Streptomyces sp. NPDC093111]|uniref:hypothetical protein n=1 Tax=Streptomyces sp. NPDC093111 TaxID=3154978 RepID=UPI003420FE7B